MSDSSEEYSNSPEMDRNPSPPPENAEESAEEALEDAIGATVYSKHWLFSTLTRLMQSITEQNSGDEESLTKLSEEQEDELCKVWDMAMDQDVAGFLQEFKAPDILLAVIAKSRCPRLTEICVGILGNMACFHDTCLDLSQNGDLGAVLLLLLGDPDPPTLLETCRLLLTCMSQADVSSLWLERISQQPSVCASLCFIMSSSTNVDLLVKVGELVDKLFDEDEELMRRWVSGNSLGNQNEGNCNGDEPQPDVTTSLLEAAKQLRSESSEGLEVYLHAIQLLTTIDEGIQAMVCKEGSGGAVWEFLCAVVCEDLCQLDDPSLSLQEQKASLGPALAVLSALYTCQGQHFTADISLNLVGSVLRVLQYYRENQLSRRQEGHTDPDQQHSQDEEDGHGEEDVQLTALVECTCEILASMLVAMSRDEVSELLKSRLLTEENCSSAAKALLPQHATAVRHLVGVLSDVEPKLADGVRKEFPTLQTQS